jgi:hypothetical protein
MGTAVIERGIDNLLRVIESTGCRVIMDHHAVREAAFEARFERLWATKRVVTAAGHLGLPLAALESRRRQLWTEVARKPAAPVRPPLRPAARATLDRTLTKRRATGHGGRIAQDPQTP